MDNTEAKKRIAFWEAKKEAYARKNNTSGIARAEDAISRIKAATEASQGKENKRPMSIVESESKKKRKTEDKEVGYKNDKSMVSE